jgi:hypothetical protein
MAKSDAEAALKWVQKYGAHNQSAFWRGVFENAKGEPEDLWRMVRKNVIGYTQNNALKALSNNWSGRDFESFIEKSREFPPEEKEAAVGMVNAWASRHFEVALAYAQSVEDPDERRVMVGAALNGASNNGDYVQAWKLAKDLAPDYREFFKVGDEVSNEEVAVALLYGDLNAGLVAIQLVHRDPEEGARWAVNFRDIDSIESEIPQLTKGWADEDPQGASEWLRTLPPSKARDLAAAGLVEAVAPFDPAGAFVWAAEIGDAGKRAAALDQSFEAWSWSDPNAAVAALENSQLSDAEKARLLKQGGAE